MMKTTSGLSVMFMILIISNWDFRLVQLLQKAWPFLILLHSTHSLDVRV